VRHRVPPHFNLSLPQSSSWRGPKVQVPLYLSTFSSHFYIHLSHPSGDRLRSR